MHDPTKCPKCGFLGRIDPVASFTEDLGIIRECLRPLCRMVWDEGLVRVHWELDTAPHQGSPLVPYSFFPPRHQADRYVRLNENATKIGHLFWNKAPIRYRVEPKPLGIQYLAWINAMSSTWGTWVMWV